MRRIHAIIAFAALLALGIPARPAPAQEAPAAEAAADTVSLSLGEALDIGLRRNPQVLKAGYGLDAAGAGLWSAYGRLLPQVSLTGQAQKSQAGKFAFLGTEFTSPQTYTTGYEWDFVHSLLDSGRDLFRIKSARATADKAGAAYDAQTLETTSQIESQYLSARRAQALVRQAERELERRQEHLRLAQGRYDVGAVTRSDVLQARLAINQGRVALLQARQDAEEARLALRGLLGGALPEGPLRLTTDFEVFQPGWKADDLVRRAIERHPGLREARAQERVDSANLWIARSAYLPSLQFQYSLTRSVVDTHAFSFSDFSDRNYYAVSLSWPLFGRFERYDETSKANAALQSSREEERRQRLTVEQQVRAALSRLETAWASHQANAVSVDLADEDLRLGQARYETGTGSFVDLLDSRVRASQAETDLITSTYDFYLALADLQRATGLDLFTEGGSE